MADKSNSSAEVGVSKASVAAGAVALTGAAVNLVAGGGSDRIKIGLIGCGGRGTGAVADCMKADPAVTVVAVHDVFQDKAQGAAKNFASKYKDRSQIKDDHVFWGLHGYRQLCASDLQVVLMATPPVFRPFHLRAAIEGGKHVFMEKPVAVDPAGCRSVIESARMADAKHLGITCGTQRRHANDYTATMEQIHGGAIGELVGGQTYWNGGGIWYRAPKPGMSELEWQCYNWYHWTWLSGDQICEQHIHNIDIINWCFQGPPVKFLGMGGRLTRGYEKEAEQASIALNGNASKTELYRGDIYCHIGTELEYANGARVLSMGRHAPASTNRVSERIVGTKGTSDCSGSIHAHDGSEIWRYKGPNSGGRTEEHGVLLQYLKGGKPVNEGKRIAESTLTAVGARMSAYTGREFSWQWLLNTSKLEYLPPEMEKQLKPGPGIFHPVAIPGKEKLI